MRTAARSGVVVVRDASAEDASAIAHVEVTTWQASYDGILPPHLLRTTSVPRARARWAHALGAPSRSSIHVTIVALVEGELVGFASGNARRAAPPRMARLDLLYVLPAFQRLGAGRALLRGFAARMESEGVSAMWLEVLARNVPARRFYRAMGGAELDRIWRFMGTTPIVVVPHGWSLPMRPTLER